jgi:hypothetical protein
VCQRDEPNAAGALGPAQAPSQAATSRFGWHILISKPWACVLSYAGAMQGAVRPQSEAPDGRPSHGKSKQVGRTSKEL